MKKVTTAVMGAACLVLGAGGASLTTRPKARALATARTGQSKRCGVVPVPRGHAPAMIARRNSSLSRMLRPLGVGSDYGCARW
jgi:hypothetical protein